MKKKSLTALLEAFAVGDAMGMPTEFMTRQEIAASVGKVAGLLPSGKSFHHPDLEPGTVTDDTEQNLYLLREYCSSSVSVESTVRALRKWIRETDAVSKRYIGPSSLRALQAIEAGEDPETTGLGGTTCGGIMRSPAPALCCWARGASEEETALDIRACLLPTHNTSQALEAACAYAFALIAALNGESREDIVAAALRGAERGLGMAPYRACASSSGERIAYLARNMESFPSGEKLLDFLFGVFGTGLDSQDVCAAVFALFLYAKDDVWEAIRLASSAGGDTDTIAALTGALCAAYAGGHNIPADVADFVTVANGLDFRAIEECVRKAFHRDAE